MNVIGRKSESKLLQRYANSNQAEFVAVLGRRRVGKTYLISKTFEGEIDFETSGVLNGSNEDQFAAFNQSLRRIGYEGDYAEKWMDAFFALEQTLLPKLNNNKRHIIFIDELPCFDIRGTRFVAALGNFWNSFVSKYSNLMLIVCGSATSWMIKNVVDNKGGLHNRITHEIHLHPFTLQQCEQYVKWRNIAWDRMSILQAYMIFGGIPYYLSLIQPEDSVATAVDRLFFSANGELHKEYNRLFSSLFQNPEPYIEIVRALATHRYGLTRDELVTLLGKSAGGKISTQLGNLEKCDFIYYHRVKSKNIKKTGGYYSLADFFIQFYHTFMEQDTADDNFWSHNMLSAKVNVFFGLSFERVYMAHISQIKKAIGVGKIGTEHYSWRSNNAEQKTQIDLVIERADRIINLCEIKYSQTPYIIDKDEDMRLRVRQSEFVQQTKTRFGIQPTYITTFGLAQNAYSNSIQQNITMDDLFEE